VYTVFAPYPPSFTISPPPLPSHRYQPPPTGPLPSSCSPISYMKKRDFCLFKIATFLLV
jgi:hypothetical protein